MDHDSELSVDCQPSTAVTDGGGKTCSCESKVHQLENAVQLLCAQVKTMERNMEAFETMKQQMTQLQSTIGSDLTSMLPGLKVLLAEAEQHSRSSAAPPVAVAGPSSILPESALATSAANNANGLCFLPSLPSAPPSYEEVVAGAMVSLKTEVIRTSTRDEGPSRLEVAAQKGYVSMVENLLRCGGAANIQELNNALVIADNAVILQMLLSAGADPNAQDSNGWTALHWAAQMGLGSNILVLKRAGAVLEPGDNWGNTPLHVAAQYDKKDAVHVLLNSGAQRNALNKEGKRPFDVAVSAYMRFLLNPC